MSAATATVAITVDARPAMRMLAQMCAAMDRLSGLGEGAAYVRGAMHPGYAAPGTRDVYARALATSGPGGPALAAAFLRGWAEHHETVPAPVVWHRLIGGTRVVVGGAA